MAMTVQEAALVANNMRAEQDTERANLDQLRRYWTGKQALPLIVPADAPREVRVLARKSRVNVIKIVIESITQSLIVSGIRTADFREDKVAAEAWRIWQANAMDRRQSGLVRATTAYGTGYAVALPGDPAPVIRPVGPRQMTTQYAADDDVWPVRALWRMSKSRFRLLDDEAVYEFGVDDQNLGTLFMVGEPSEHNAREYGRPVCPVVRFKDAEDLDEDDEAPPGFQTIDPYNQDCPIVAGQVAPLMDLQDQINMTSFALKSAEWYLAFRQRWMIGKALKQGEKVRAGASQVWSFDEDPDHLKVGEFGQTDLRGFLDSRAESMKYAATLSQTPVHELIGELVNLSAEALAAAEIGRDRMVSERETGQGESYEQLLRLACSYEDMELPEDAEMTWKDTSARAFGAVVDGLGKIAQMLQVPPQALWEKIPGATKQEVERWTKLFEQGDSLKQMTDMLDRQAAGGEGGETRTGSGLILPAGARV